MKQSYGLGSLAQSETMNQIISLDTNEPFCLNKDWDPQSMVSTMFERLSRLDAHDFKQSFSPAQTGYTSRVESLLLGPQHSISTSYYWKVPDKSQFLTSVAVRESDGLVAVGSGANEGNLFIYELNTMCGKPVATHHQKVSLPNIHSMHWISPKTALGAQGNVLVSGHTDGLVHLTLLPDTYSTSVPAEILKRFNHTRHLSPCNGASTRINNLRLTPQQWSCCEASSITTLCGDNIFIWNPARSDIPMLKQQAKKAHCLDLSELRDGVVALGGAKGISIRDLRAKGRAGLSPPEGNHSAVHKVRWSPTNRDIVASVHREGVDVVKIWDIRAQAPLLEHRGHLDAVTGLEFSPVNETEVVTSSFDGSLRVWSTMYPSSPARREPSGMFSCTQKEAYLSEELDRLALETETRSAVLHNKRFASLGVCHGGAVTIDQEACLGFHWLRKDVGSPLSSTSETSENDYIPPISLTP